jgi:YjbE family integral membrane protein
LDNPAHLEFWLALFQIISINLVLSGDNAAVIALAARRLQGSLRHQAIIIGSLGAVLLRVLLTVVAVQLLAIPYLQTMGGILLLWVAARLVRSHGKKPANVKDNSATLQEAVRAIIIADVVMSFDNVLSLAAVARGSWLLLTIGLLTSIPLIMVGSTLLMKLMTRYPAIITLGAGLLGYVAGDMLLSDPLWQHMDFLQNAWIHNSIPALFALGIILLGSDPTRGQTPGGV